MKITHLKKIIQVFNQSGLSSLEINDYQGRIRLAKDQTDHLPETGMLVKKDQTVSKEPVLTDAFTITAPFVGTFYAASGPDQAAFVKAGDQVVKGQTVAIIEAMKMMNEVKAAQDGRIEAVLAADGSPVEYGQALFSLTKAGDAS